MKNKNFTKTLPALVAALAITLILAAQEQGTTMGTPSVSLAAQGQASSMGTPSVSLAAQGQASATDTTRVILREKGSITFVVDGSLDADSTYFDYLFSGRELAGLLLSKEQVPKDARHIVATSFERENNLMPRGKDAFYRCIVDAYANHLSVTLSPDMVWLVISQGFARYVNAHAEELRPKLVSHTGKMDLAVQSDKDLLSEAVDWPMLIDEFATQIDKYTKGDIAKTMVADFTTTGPVERVVSQITLMESVKSYFEYIVYYISCGIPTVTLLGTAQDWQRILEKTRQLEQYGLGQWVASLEPVLAEFVKAADGHPSLSFWQSMVKRQRVDQLEGGGCSADEPTEIDGWLLKLFPDENGETLDKVKHTKEMPSEYVRVGFKYRIIGSTGKPISETPMELWAGFVGVKADYKRNMLTPKMGWIVRVAENDEETLNELKKHNNEWGIHLRVAEVPDMLAHLSHIEKLHLVFTGKVVLPKWMDKLTIDHLTVEGEISEAESSALKKRFPRIRIIQVPQVAGPLLLQE